jgi:hypothetical protein
MVPKRHLAEPRRTRRKSVFVYEGIRTYRALAEVTNRTGRCVANVLKEEEDSIAGCARISLKSKSECQDF